MDPVALMNWPFLKADASAYALSVTDSDASVALPAGGYHVVLVSASTPGATLCIGGAAEAPTNGGGAVAASLAMVPGAVYTLQIRNGDGDLHAVMNTSGQSGTLYINKVR